LPAIVESVLLPVIPIASTLGAVGLYRLNPLLMRAPGKVSSRPRLQRDGSNVAAVLDWLRVHEPRAHSGAVQCVQTVWPTLEEIDVARAPHDGIELAFREAGFKQPWTAQEVSDGTLRALGLFTALFDPSVKVVVIDEPENSLHPWAVWHLIDVCRELADEKQVILTTQSLDLMDHFRPEQIWVVSKRDGASQVEPLDEIDADARGGWEEGQFTLSEYLDSGIVPQAVPVLSE
jgi:predicted ATPase